MEQLLLTIPEAAKVIGLGKSKLYQLVGAGHLPVVRIGKSVRVSRQELEAFVAKLEAGTLRL